VSSTLDVSSRKNLFQISKVLTQITTGALFAEDAPCYIPINDYVGKAIVQLGAWLIEGREKHSHGNATADPSGS
jgi:Ras GTPase-activating-like protein IQGAP2/3